jgi:hypothetical protein
MAISSLNESFSKWETDKTGERRSEGSPEKRSQATRHSCGAKKPRVASDKPARTALQNGDFREAAVDA